MALYCGTSNSAAPCKAAKDFLQFCFIDGESIFTRQPIWTKKNTQLLIKYFMNNPDAGSGDFLEKLEAQLAPQGEIVNVF